MVVIVDLTHAFIPAMLARGTGAVLNVASLGAFFAMPYQSVYAATTLLHETEKDTPFLIGVVN